MAAGFPVFGAFLNNSSGLPAPANVITFSELVLAQNTEILSQYSSFGVTFSPRVRYNPSGALGTPYPNFNGVFAANFGGSNPIGNPASIFFTTAQTSAAFALATEGGVTSTFEALLGGVVQDSASRVTTFTSSTNFFGFTGVTFDQIRITEAPGAGLNGSFAFDNIQFGVAAPEPASTFLVPAGLVVILFWALRVRRSATL